MSQQKRMFKVLGIVPKHSNPRETAWVRVGVGFVNRDNSINIHLDAMPRSFELQLREFDEEDLRKREANNPALPAPVPFTRAPGDVSDNAPF